MAERETRASLTTLVGDGLLLLCALTGFTGSFLTLYGDREAGDAFYRATPLDLCAARLDTFLLLAALFALLALTAWSLPRFRSAAAGGLTGLVAVAAALDLGTVIQGAGLTVQIITGIFSRRVSWGWEFRYDPGLTPSGERAAVQLFLILALALLALALGWAVVRARRWWLAAALTLPPLLPGLLADLFPNWPLFMALWACWCAMLLCDLCKWAAPSARGKLTLASLACVSIVLATITLAFPRDGYSRPQWALQLETGISDAAGRLGLYFSDIEGPFRSPVTYVGDAGAADLTDAGPLNYTGRTALRVTTDYDGRLYLRGTSLAVYEDGVWTALPEGAYEEDYLDAAGDDAPSPLLFPFLHGLKGEQYTTTVEHAGAAGSHTYVPYYPDNQDWEAGGMLPVEDSYFARLQGQRTFTITFSDCSPSNGASRTERAYYTMLQEHYLDVPEELREPLLELCHLNGLFEYPIRGGFIFDAQDGQDVILDVTLGEPGMYTFQDPVDAAQKIARVLDKLCEYDPQTPAAPEGTDPVLWFLQDSRRGYCMHYASAAVLMLRALGVHARYVSGFTAYCQPDEQVNVPDRAAHAWVEVWVDGFGWQPVEVTPAAAFDWYENGDAEPSPTPSEEVQESETPEPTPTPEPEPSEEPSGSPSEAPGGPEEADGPAILARAAKALAAAAVLLFLLWLGQWLPKRVRARKLAGPERNRAVLEGYGCLQRLERWGGRMDGRAVELAQKAKFSQHILSREELAEMRALVDRERARLCDELGSVKRLAFRYLWGKPPRGRNGKNTEDPPENRG